MLPGGTMRASERRSRHDVSAVMVGSGISRQRRQSSVEISQMHHHRTPQSWAGDNLPSTNTTTAEEYKLDEKELAALERLYDYPARSSLTATSLGWASDSGGVLRKQKYSAAAESATTAAITPPGSCVSSLSARRRQTKRRGQSSSRLEQQSSRSSPLHTDSADRAPLSQQEVIARLLAEAAKSPPPPIPARRPDVSSMNVRARLTAGVQHSSEGQIPRDRPPPPPATYLSAAVENSNRWHHLSSSSVVVAPSTSTPVQNTSVVHQRRCSLDGLIAAPSRPSSVSSQSLQHQRCTPDWITNIFNLARSGDTNALSTAVAGMEPTMVRNLADRHGNNLAHVLCAGGHVTTLAWLWSYLETEDVQCALLDRNQHAITPVVAAVRFGRLNIIQWLVEKTVVKNQLFAREGERTLLHVAAKYGQCELVAWCCDMLEQQQLSVDAVDHRCETPLHLAAKAGNLSIVQQLTARGAAVTAKNDTGLKPYDLATHFGHDTCAQFLLTHEAFTELAVDFTSLQCEAVRVQQENHEYKNNFREVMSVCRKLLREREDMCRQLGQLHDDSRQLNEQLLLRLQQFSVENQQLHRQSLNSSGRADECAEIKAGDSSVEWAEQMITELDTRWQQCQRGWFSTQLADAQHRLSQAEQAWQRLRTTRKDIAVTSAAVIGNKFSTAAAEIVTNKVADLRAQAASVSLARTQRISSSETSLVDSELYQQIAPRDAASTADGCAEPRRQAGPIADMYGVRQQNTRMTRQILQAPTAARTNVNSSSYQFMPASSIGSLRLANAPNGLRGSSRDSVLRKSADLLERLSVSTRDSASGPRTLSNSVKLSRSVGILDSTRLSSLNQSQINRTVHTTVQSDHVPNTAKSKTAPGYISQGEESQVECRFKDSGSVGSTRVSRDMPRDVGDIGQSLLTEPTGAMALQSDNGEASVLEVIEPSADEAADVSATQLVQKEIEAQRRSHLESDSGDSLTNAFWSETDTKQAIGRSNLRSGSTSQRDSNDFLGHRLGKPHRFKATSKFNYDPPKNEHGRPREVLSNEGPSSRYDRAHHLSVFQQSIPDAGMQQLCEPDILQGTKLLDCRDNNTNSGGNHNEPARKHITENYSESECSYETVRNIKVHAQSEKPASNDFGCVKPSLTGAPQQTEISKVIGHSNAAGSDIVDSSQHGALVDGSYQTNASSMGGRASCQNLSPASDHVNDSTLPFIRSEVHDTIAPVFNGVLTASSLDPPPSTCPQSKPILQPESIFFKTSTQSCNDTENMLNTGSGVSADHPVGDAPPSRTSDDDSNSANQTDVPRNSAEQPCNDGRLRTTSGSVHTVIFMPLKNESSKERRLRRIERPWYEVSDDESDMTRVIERVEI